jgi:glycosyltransferase involved in cell wall biosynthesis
MSKGYSVTFLGFKQTDFVIEYLQYNRCIVVNPSHQEWLPTTVIEWLMTKCPVVASNVWWTSEISNWKDLLLFESQDIPGLQQCLKSAIDDYDNMTWISFKQVSEKFSWEKNITKLYQYIR